MLDGTWQLVKVAGWQHGGGRWRCLLQWGVEGTVYEGWYLVPVRNVPPAANERDVAGQTGKSPMTSS
jgi:hypothetical protein